MEASVRKPTLSQVFSQYGENFAARIRVCIPAKIKKIDNATQRIDAQPLIHRKIKNGNEREPVIRNIPVCFPRSGDTRITFPLSVDDTVFLFFGDHSFEEWILTHGRQEVQASDPRHHDISDAIAIPTSILPIIPFEENLSKSSALDNRLWITHRNATIFLDDDGIVINGGLAGKIAIGSKSVELIQQVIDIINQLVAASNIIVSGVVVGGGVAAGQFNPTVQVQLTSIQTQLSSIRRDLEE